MLGNHIRRYLLHKCSFSFHSLLHQYLLCVKSCARCPVQTRSETVYCTGGERQQTNVCVIKMYKLFSVWRQLILGAMKGNEGIGSREPPKMAGQDEFRFSVGSHYLSSEEAIFQPSRCQNDANFDIVINFILKKNHFFPQISCSFKYTLTILPLLTLKILWL